MQFFDAHCDAVINAMEDGLGFVEGDHRGHLDLPRLIETGVRVQIFAVFTSLGYHPEPDRDLTAYARKAIQTIHDWAGTSGDRLRIAHASEDIRQAFALPDSHASQSIYGLIGMEGADPLGERAENLVDFFNAGVRDLIPAWDDNGFSGTTFGTGGALTAEGIKLIELAEALGVMVDVSHLSDAAFQQVRAITRRPFIASHSNCRAVCPNLRNLTDEMIRAIADRGGVMGINLAPSFLAPEYNAAWDSVMAPVANARMVARRDFERKVAEQLHAIPLPVPEWIVHHVRHAMRVGGEDYVGLGGDLDGIARLPSGMTGVESYPAIPNLLIRAGLTERQAEKVCWRNMARVFADVLADRDA